MIDWVSNWANAIIVAVIIGTIIEMILPEGNSKKYIKVVIGIYVLFTIVSPVITRFMGADIEVSDTLDLDKYVDEVKETSKMQNTIQHNNENNIMDIYLEGIQNDIKAKIESKGYKASNVKVEIANDESYNILSIDIDVNKTDNTIQEKNEEENDNLNSEVEIVEDINEIEINISKDSDMDNSVNEDSKKRRVHLEY